MRIPCLLFGKVFFNGYENGMADEKSLGGAHQPSSLRVPLDSHFHTKEDGRDQILDLFVIAASNIRLACTPIQQGVWTVVTRAFARRDHERSAGSHQEKSAPNFMTNIGFMCTIFEGLYIIKENSGKFVLELKDAAQFMEILLDDRGLSSNLGRLQQAKGGASLPKLESKYDKTLAGLPQVVKCGASLADCERREDENPLEKDYKLKNKFICSLRLIANQRSQKRLGVRNPSKGIFTNLGMRLQLVFFDGNKEEEPGILDRHGKPSTST
jgi:hypothetical protein